MIRDLCSVLALVCGLAACTRAVDDADEIYVEGPRERVLCGLGVDSEDVALPDLERAMARALERDEVLILFAHTPGRTVSYERIDAILALAESLGLPSVTFPELAGKHTGAGLSLGFDDFSVDAWFGMRDSLRALDVRVTFFVSNFGELTTEQRDKLHVLWGDGHAIEAHGMGHRNAPEYADTHGLSRYLADEVDPLLDQMTAAGFAPTTFAYPFGDRTAELDRAMLERFTLLRSLTYLDRGVLNDAPCPR